MAPSKCLFVKMFESAYFGGIARISFTRILFKYRKNSLVNELLELKTILIIVADFYMGDAKISGANLKDFLPGYRMVTLLRPKSVIAVFIEDVILGVSEYLTSTPCI